MRRELVTLGEILKSKVYDEMSSPLTLALGKDIGGNSVVADLLNASFIDCRNYWIW